MKVFEKEDVESTSTLARQMLADGEAPPFLVTAKSQSAGRGRTGRHWTSPRGNAYFTLVLPLSPARKDMGLIPLQVAHMIAAFCWERFKLGITIKWPNDILFGGAKLGGILCETTADGAGFGPCLVGVGLNFNVAPQLEDQDSTSFQKILGQTYTGRFIASFMSDLCRRLWESWEEPLALDLEAFFTDKGQPWTDGRSLLWQGDMDRKSGMLTLEPSTAGKPVTLNSTHHGYRWLYQSDDPMFLADVGNSSLKLCYFPKKDGEAKIWYFDLSKELEASQVEQIKALMPQKGWPLHVGSVNVSHHDHLQTLIDTCALTVVPIKKRSIRVDFSAYQFSQMGIDRVALIEAMASENSEHHKIGVSCGTALTVEALTCDRKYLGGWILPGLQVSLKAMHDATDKLPSLSMADNYKGFEGLALGVNTKTAMVGGVVQGAALMLKQLRYELKSQYGGEWQFYITGGAGDVLANILEVEFREALILQGLRHLVLRG